MAMISALSSTVDQGHNPDVGLQGLRGNTWLYVESVERIGQVLENDPAMIQVRRARDRPGTVGRLADTVGIGHADHRLADHVAIAVFDPQVGAAIRVTVIRSASMKFL